MTEPLYPLIFHGVAFCGILRNCSSTSLSHYSDACGLRWHINVIVHFVHNIFSLNIFQIRKLLKLCR